VRRGKASIFSILSVVSVFVFQLAKPLKTENTPEKKRGCLTSEAASFL
jgi:hypothetical protein